ncbi:MAG: CBO0543 family protein [Solirubrobacterales bacterium]
MNADISAYLNTYVPKLYDVRDFTVNHWLRSELFSWVWWLNVVVMIAFLLVAWIYIDRKRILEISIFGFFMNVFSSFLDVGGAEIGLWTYTCRLFPVSPLMFPIDFAVLPIVYMFVYQRFQAWKPFLLASLIAAAFFAFAGEPLAVRIGMYRMLHWEYIYSFPIYTLLAAAAKGLTQLMLWRQSQADPEP